MSIAERLKREIKFTNNNTITTKRVGKVLIQIRDGKQSFMYDVLFIPNAKNSLLSLGQFLENEFIVKIEHGKIKMFDSSKRLILKARRQRTKPSKFRSKVAHKIRSSN